MYNITYPRAVFIIYEFNLMPDVKFTIQCWTLIIPLLLAYYANSLTGWPQCLILAGTLPNYKLTPSVRTNS